ncbi:endonuclease/exonuclease/phosphatase family protein [Meridianimaribacter flavus]|uniref:Endonuclease/Exonuclease/phosphatase family protein n=1 Tax=Meridianimaribacter flavus TaxID=571115 RepID=A0ABY2G6I7_9FLAO|nr:endonuclease/exonuclease/phosphatase family protein [Meridianimaribacter flavus]TDY13414.1 Endonuclease/Exonuclease/phosphatase family protein [Meridianimaribacter flavus]
MQYTIAFYNIENLFDIHNDPFTNDDDFLPTSDKRWTQKKYDRKIYKIGSVISQIGTDENTTPPAIVGLAEVENKRVLKDLLASKDLQSINYDYVHYNSLDERGIDVALIYNKDVFTVNSSETFNIFITDEDGEIDFTRDVLLVSGMLGEEEIHIIVNHWPSRREGEEASSYKRVLAAQKNIEVVNRLKQENPNSKIIVMGDFNDNPDDDSVEELVAGANLYNPMQNLRSIDKGSLNHDFNWNVFDQIMVSINFLETKPSTLKFSDANIFDSKFLTQYNGKYKGQPYRTFVGKKYKGGFSDHFPVFIELKKTY